MKKDGQNLVALLFILGLFSFYTVSSVFKDVLNQFSSTSNGNRLNEQKVHSTEHTAARLEDLDNLEDDTIEEIIGVEGKETKPSCCACPEGQFFFQDIIVDDATYNDAPEGTIPKTIHFFSKSKCIPEQVYTVLNTWMNAFQDYSILLHDFEEISTHLSKPRQDLPFLSNAFKCAFSHEAILDLARFVFLYDYGGISTDLNQLPGEGMMKFANRTFVQPKYNDNYWIELENDQPRFIAAVPKHINMYSHMQLSIASQFVQFAFNRTLAERYLEKRKDIYAIPFKHDYGPNFDYNETIYRKHSRHGFGVISAIMSSRIDHNSFLQALSLEENVLEQTRFRTRGQKGSDIDKEVKQCVDLNNNSFKVDYGSLKEIAGSKNEQHNKTCPNSNLTYIENSLLFTGGDMYSNNTRKIPKIIHMTSKNRCFTKRYADNIQEWIKSTRYAFVLHDDSAVDRLLSKEWSEFPLLHQILPCITSGAMKADLWRYLALWEWGGLYTDMDNTPGHQWAIENGTVISDGMDAVFEIEVGGYASQYFYAISPKHPASYFMVSVTIQRILYVLNSLNRLKQTAFITGPGALKSSIMTSFGGNGYYTKGGDYIGKADRNMTMIGSRKDARRAKYVGRSRLRTEKNVDESAMDMPHYMKGSTKAKENRKYSCRVELMRSMSVEKMRK